MGRIFKTEEDEMNGRILRLYVEKELTEEDKKRLSKHLLVEKEELTELERKRLSAILIDSEKDDIDGLNGLTDLKLELIEIEDRLNNVSKKLDIIMKNQEEIKNRRQK